MTVEQVENLQGIYHALETGPDAVILNDDLKIWSAATALKAVEKTFEPAASPTRSMNTSSPSSSSFSSTERLVEGTIAGDAASAAGDARAQAAREGLSFAAQQFGEDRAAQLAQAERDRAARFQAEAAARGQFVSDREALMSQSERDRAARFAAESALAVLDIFCV